MTIGWAFVFGAAILWTIQIVSKDLKRTDRR
jgi:hypothetical protein